MRNALCRKSGMRRSSTDVYELAKACYQCHVVSHEGLVSQGGHKTGRYDFEWVTWSQGEVRHNFHLNPRHNAAAATLWTDSAWHKGGNRRTAAARHRVMYVVGQLVDIEISLRNRARATTPAFATSASGRVAAANAKLSQIVGIVQLPEMKEVLDRVKQATPELFLPVAPGQGARFERLADEVSTMAKKFAVIGDHESFAAMDAMVPQGAMGRVYRP